MTVAAIPASDEEKRTAKVVICGADRSSLPQVAQRHTQPLGPPVLSLREKLDLRR